MLCLYKRSLVQTTTTEYRERNTVSRILRPKNQFLYSPHSAEPTNVAIYGAGKLPRIPCHERPPLPLLFLSNYSTEQNEIFVYKIKLNLDISAYFLRKLVVGARRLLVNFSVSQVAVDS